MLPERPRPEHPALKRFKAKRCATLEEVRAWVEGERRGQTRTDKDKHGPGKAGKTSARGRESPCASVPTSAESVANSALSLLNLCCYFLDRQLAAQAAAFEKEGGFTERLYRVRNERRR